MRRGALITGVLMLAAVAFALTGCKGVVGNGEVIKREIALSQAVMGVTNAGSFDVVIDPSLKGKAVLEGESNILDFVDAYQDGTGAFKVGVQEGVSIFSGRTVTVRMPKVEGGTIEINGSGDIRLAGNAPLKGDAFELKIAGSGGIDLAVDAQTLKCDIFGSGDIAVKGTAKSSDVEINGSGNYNAAECKTANTVVRILGSGSAQVDASEGLECHIFGSGNVLYRGNPPKVKVESSGSGRVSSF